MHDVMPPLPSPARFEAALDTVFEMRPLDGAGAPIGLRLVQVKVMSAPEGWEQFAAVFVGPAAPVRGQGIYRFAHPALGAMDLFAVPIGPGRGGMQYEICINREAPGTDPAR